MVLSIFIGDYHKQLKWTTLKIHQNYQIKAIFLPKIAKNGFV